MGRAFLYGAGGGGAPLNYTVAAVSALPASAKENTIAVVTDTPVTEHQFSASRPAARPDGSPLAGGEVWFKTGQSSSVALNLLTKNAAIVCPLAAEQYVQGSWVSKTARIRINGAWKAFIPPTIVVVPNLAEFPSSAWQLGSGASVNASSFTIGMTSASPIYSWLRTPIDLGDYKTLSVACSFTNANVCQVGVCRTLGSSAMLASASQALASGTLAVDLSSLTGTGYLCVFPYVSGGSTVTRVFTATSIQFVP